MQRLEPVKPDRALEFLTSRGFNLAYGVVMGLAFGAIGWFSEGFAQLVWIFGAGLHTGIAFMWLISPVITEKWRKEMREELEKITDECVREGNARMQAEADRIWSPTITPNEPNERLH